MENDMGRSRVERGYVWPAAGRRVRGLCVEGAPGVKWEGEGEGRKSKGRKGRGLIGWEFRLMAFQGVRRSSYA